MDIRNNAGTRIRARDASPAARSRNYQTNYPSSIRLPSKRNKQEQRNNETLLTQIRLKLSEYKLSLLQTRLPRLNSHATNTRASR